MCIRDRVKSGSAEPNRKKVAELTWEQIRTIAQDKMVDLNCFTVEAAMRDVYKRQGLYHEGSSFHISRSAYGREHQVGRPGFRLGT